MPSDRVNGHGLTNGLFSTVFKMFFRLTTGRRTRRVSHSTRIKYQRAERKPKEDVIVLPSNVTSIVVRSHDAQTYRYIWPRPKRSTRVIGTRRISPTVVTRSRPIRFLCGAASPVSARAVGNSSVRHLRIMFRRKYSNKKMLKNQINKSDRTVEN